MLSLIYVRGIPTICRALIKPALELRGRAVPSVEAHHHVSGPNTGKNSLGRQIIEKLTILEGSTADGGVVVLLVGFEGSVVIRRE